MLLCLDTSHGAAVALLDGTHVRGRAANDNPRQHTESLTPLIMTMLEGAQVAVSDLTGIVAGTGPAPFTGLRVGLITARTLAYSLGIPVHGVSTLAGLARTVFDGEDLPAVTVLTDARRKEVYWATYAPAGAHDVAEISPPAVARPAEIADTLRGSHVRGPGVTLYPEHFSGTAPALDVAALGRIAEARLAAAPGVVLPTEPLYLRRPDIHPGTGTKRAT